MGKINKNFKGRRKFIIKKLNKRKKHILIFVAILIVIMIILGCIFGKKIINMFKKPQEFRIWVSSLGIWGKFFMIAVSAFQIIVAVIPGEPIEIAAGYAYGWFWGAVLCLIGNLIGQSIVFLITKKYGMDFIEIFVSEKKLKKMKFLKNRKKIYMTTFFIFLIPGMPKDVFSYAAGITSIKLIPFLFISGVARIPSIVSSTIGGGYLGIKNYNMAIIIFIVTLAISGIAYLVYKNYEKRGVDD